MFQPEAKSYRFVVLFFASLLTFGSYFAYDIIGAIAPSLVEELGASRGTIGGFYTSYSIAAIISVLVGGILIDRMGTRRSSLIFSSLVLVGAVIVWGAPALAKGTDGLLGGVLGGWGITERILTLDYLFLGRFVFGAGAEPLVVAQSAILARWFLNKEMALAFGIALTISRLGTLFSFNLGELLVDHYGGTGAALFAAVLFCLLSLAGNLVYIALDRRGEKALKLEDSETEEKIKTADIRHFGPAFWYIALLCVTFYSAIFPFTALSTDFFVDKWDVPRVAESSGSFLSQAMNNYLHMFKTAGGLSSIIIFASMIFAPFAGHFVDRYGKRALLMVLGSLAMIPAHAVMGLTSLYPVIPMIVLGVAFVLVPAAMWPAVPLIVDKKRVGTAFGVITMIQQVGLGLFPWLNGMLRDKTEGYTASMLMFASLGVVGLVFAVLLKRADRAIGNVLEKPGT